MEFLKSILDFYRYDSVDPITSIFVYVATALVIFLWIVILNFKRKEAKEKKRQEINLQIHNDLDAALEELGQTEDNNDSTIDERKVAFDTFIKKVLTLSDLAEENKLLHLEAHLLTIAQKMKNAHNLSMGLLKKIKDEA